MGQSDGAGRGTDFDSDRQVSGSLTEQDGVLTLTSDVSGEVTHVQVVPQADAVHVFTEVSARLWNATD